RNVDVRVGARLAVGAERFAKRLLRGCGTKSGIAVDIARADSRLGDDAQSVVLLQEELPGVVEGKRVTRVLVPNLATLANDQRHGFLPRCFTEGIAIANKSIGETVGALVRDPAK